MRPIAALILATVSAASTRRVNAAFASFSSFSCRKYRCAKPLNSQRDEFVSKGDHDPSCALLTNRRKLLTSSCTAATALILSPNSATAAKGAAEYDFEFYVRDLVFGNKKEGNLPASNAPPLPPPRKLKDPLLSLLLDDELTTCIPVQELAKLSGAPIAEISARVMEFRTKVQPAFSSRYPWKETSVTDEYYFDCTIYSLWKVAAFYIQDYTTRDVYVRNIGRRILNEMKSKEMLSKETITSILDKKGPSLTETVASVNEILTVFQNTNFCSGYRLGEKNDEVRSGLQMFDELDNQEIVDGGSVNALVSVFNPATLGASLQITGEGSRFAPDFVGPTLAAIWEKVGGGKQGKIEVGWESYFVDPVYRPNPKVRLDFMLLLLHYINLTLQYIITYIYKGLFS
ncbi:hypothetical protein ACHAWO_011048 [Cyclotella atomus]|uniref:Uncharacterized protein n=1 Tax=Cyclotella atomus TaxID=382360 RepID=A0ABD3N056_9STRA